MEGEILMLQDNLILYHQLKHCNEFSFVAQFIPLAVFLISFTPLTKYVYLYLHASFPFGTLATTSSPQPGVAAGTGLSTVAIPPLVQAASSTHPSALSTAVS